MFAHNTTAVCGAVHTYRNDPHDGVDCKWEMGPTNRASGQSFSIFFSFSKIPILVHVYVRACKGATSIRCEARVATPLLHNNLTSGRNMMRYWSLSNK